MHDADAPRRGDDFAIHQMRTTADIASPIPVLGHVFRWLVGGLDHQIEHHLAPRLPHTLYPRTAARFRAACRDHGVDVPPAPRRVVGPTLPRPPPAPDEQP